MQNDLERITGKVIVTVYDSMGDIKQTMENHNIVTNVGDALIVDALAFSPGRIAPNSSSYMAVGNGFVEAVKTSTGVNSIIGTEKLVDSSFPQQGGAWGASGDNILYFKTSWAQGSLVGDGIDEISLHTSADVIAYAEVASPTINIASNDTLVGEWYLTFLGA